MPKGPKGERRLGLRRRLTLLSLRWGYQLDSNFVWQICFGSNAQAPTQNLGNKLVMKARSTTLWVSIFAHNLSTWHLRYACNWQSYFRFQPFHKNGWELSNDSIGFKVIAVGRVIDVHFGWNNPQAFHDIESRTLLFDFGITVPVHSIHFPAPHQVFFVSIIIRINCWLSTTKH